MNKVRAHERTVGKTAPVGRPDGREGDRQEASKMNPGFWFDL